VAADMVGQVYYYQIKIYLTSTGEFNNPSRIKYGLSMAPLAENISDSRTLGDRQVKNFRYLYCSQLQLTTSSCATSSDFNLGMSAVNLCFFSIHDSGQ
jgi:hypothetical protein